MITFRCYCGLELEVPEELAGGLIQCARCGKLNDVPTLDELAHLRDDGTIELQAADEPAEGGQDLAEFARYYGPKRDASGEEIDLRPPPDRIARAGEGEALERIAPRYDPETGRLIRPLEIRRDPETAAPIPVARAALTYSTDRVMHGLTPGRILLELFMPVNAMVMVFIYIAHAIVQALAQTAARVIGPVAFLMMVLTVPLIVFILAHYGSTVDEIGPEGRDELPRPLRNVNLWDDLWAPFGRMVLGLGLAFGPLLAVVLGGWVPAGARTGLMWAFGAAGMVVLPALLITTLTAGTWLNLRPDRVWGVMRESGLGYAVAVVGSVVTSLLYLWTLFGLFLVPDATYAANPWLRHLDHPAITYSSMIMTVYFAHFTCWQMGMLYRRHHERFPWTLQRHIPRPRPQPARPHPSPPHAPQPGLPGAGGPADPRPGRQA